jgi:hypothetical protein
MNVKPTTDAIIESVLISDEDVTRDERIAILKYIRSRRVFQKPRPGTIKQAAAILEVHPVTVRRYANAGLLTPIRITARKVRYDLNEVEELALSGHHSNA